MENEVKSIIHEFENTLEGNPWFGRAVYEILEEVDESTASIKPGEKGHSMVELVYHMLTWAEFTLARIKKDDTKDMAAFEKLDWRQIDPQIHGWEEGLSALRATHQEILALLGEKNNAFLEEKVDYRKYNFRFLLHGLIQHNIYHLGQIAYLKSIVG